MRCRRGMSSLGLVLMTMLASGGSVQLVGAEEGGWEVAFEASISGPWYLAVQLEVHPGSSSPTEASLSVTGDVKVSGGEWLLASAHVVDQEGRGSSLGFSEAKCAGPRTSVRGQVSVYAVGTDYGPIGACEGEVEAEFVFEPGSYTFVWLIGSDGDVSGSIRALVREDVVLKSVSAGPGFLAHDEDFRGGIYAHGRAGSGEGQMALATSVEQTVKGALFGTFTSDGAVMWTDGPGGGLRVRASSYHGEPAGEYVFSVLAKAGGGPVATSRIWLLGADVDLPD